MRIVVDHELCEGNARCMQALPKVFEVDDNDKVVVLDPEPPEELRAKVEHAVSVCPRQALSLKES